MPEQFSLVIPSARVEQCGSYFFVHMIWTASRRVGTECNSLQYSLRMTIHKAAPAFRGKVRPVGLLLGFCFGASREREPRSCSSRTNFVVSRALNHLRSTIHNSCRVARITTLWLSGGSSPRWLAGARLSASLSTRLHCLLYPGLRVVNKKHIRRWTRSANYSESRTSAMVNPTAMPEEMKRLEPRRCPGLMCEGWGTSWTTPALAGHGKTSPWRSPRGCTCRTRRMPGERKRGV